jgi:hypothetical protein
MFALVAGRFAHVDSRRRTWMYQLGLLSCAERKNSWTIAEQAGDLTPDGMQRLLTFYRWDADIVRDDLCDYVLDHLDDPSGAVFCDQCFTTRRVWSCGSVPGGAAGPQRIVRPSRYFGLQGSRRMAGLVVSGLAGQVSDVSFGVVLALGTVSGPAVVTWFRPGRGRPGGCR